MNIRLSKVLKFLVLNAKLEQLSNTYDFFLICIELSQNHMHIINQNLTLYRALFLFFISTLSTATYSQNALYGKILMEDGSFFHGKIIDYEYDNFVVISSFDSTATFYLNQNEFYFTDQKPEYPYQFTKGRKFSKITLYSLSYSQSLESGPGYGFGYEKFYMFTDRIALGGCVQFTENNHDRHYQILSLSPSIHYFVTKSNFTILLRGSAGYGLAFGGNHLRSRGGLLTNLELGARVPSISPFIDFAFGYHRQQLNYETDTGPTIIAAKGFVGLYSIKIGFIF